MPALLAACTGPATLASVSAVSEHTLTQGLEHFRTIRHELEQSVLPLATSLDGRRFTFQASLHGLELRLGGYVVVEHDGSPERLGQVLELEPAQAGGAELNVGGTGGSETSLRAGVMIRHARGHGALLEPSGVPFHDATVRPAAVEEIREWMRRSRRPRAHLEIGELALAPGVPCALDAGGFDRHTFLCGQSGSGKTYSLGVMLERLLLETRLRIVVLDPNSDYVRLQTLRGDADAAVAERYRDAAGGMVVHSAREDGDRRLRFRLGEIDPRAQAAVLRLDPIDDREEYAEFAAFLAAGRPPAVEAMLSSSSPGTRRLGTRARNLGIEDWGVWAADQPGSTLDVLQDPGTRGVVVDLGSLATREEQALAAEAVLGELWRRREERAPVLIVIDEAHNVCPAEPEDPLTALATAHAVQIAAEGRKFGLYMLVST